MPEISMPKLSDTMTEGTLVAWKKKKGDKVSTGEVIAEIETDKATMEWESPEDGTLTEIYVEEGGKVTVGEKIAFIGEPGEAPAKEKQKPAAKEEKKEKTADPAAKKSKTETEKPAPAEEQDEDTAPPEGTEEQSGTTVKAKEPKTRSSSQQADKPGTGVRPSTEEARVKASPVARRVAAELGID